MTRERGGPFHSAGTPLDRAGACGCRGPPKTQTRQEAPCCTCGVHERSGGVRGGQEAARRGRTWSVMPRTTRLPPARACVSGLPRLSSGCLVGDQASRSAPAWNPAPTAARAGNWAGGSSRWSAACRCRRSPGASTCEQRSLRPSALQLSESTVQRARSSHLLSSSQRPAHDLAT